MLKEDTLFHNNMAHQNITGMKSFQSELHFTKNIQVAGTLDNIQIKKESILTLHSNQTISGTTSFTRDLAVESNVSVGGLVSGVNLSEIYKNRITLDTEQTIYVDIETISDMICYGNISVSGKTNNIKLSKWYDMMRSYVLYAWRYGWNIQNAIEERCDAIDYIRDALQGRYPT